MNSQGAVGIVYWILARLLWDTSKTVVELINEYCEIAFGSAATAMENYYNMWILHGLSVNSNSIALGFQYLKDAEDTVGEDADSLARIRYVECYMRWLWKSQNLDTLSQSDLEDLYTFVTQMRDTYCLNFGSTNGGMDDGNRETVSDELVERFPETYPDDATVIAALTDYTPPTNEQMATWMTEAVTEFDAQETYDAAYIGWTTLTLEALGDTETAVLPPFTSFRSITYLVQADSGNTINFSYEKDYGNSATYYLKSLDDEILDSLEIEGDNNWHSSSFTAPSTGTFKVVGEGGLDITNRPCVLINAVVQSHEFTSYFYVPSGTASILVELNNSDNDSKLYNPSNELVATIAAGGYAGVNSPASGLWKLDFQGDSVSYTSYFKIYGVPDLSGYRPEYLLIESEEEPASITTVSIRTSIIGVLC
jgi:hypothetical protein